MTKQLETEFNLPPSGEDDFLEEQKAIEERRVEAVKIMNALTTTEKIDSALELVSELDKYEGEMNEIYAEAMKSYKDFVALGMNAPIGNASRILEVANSMLKTALDATASKTGTHLKIVELQLRKARLEQDMGEISSSDDALDHRGLIELLKQKALESQNPPNEDK